MARKRKSKSAEPAPIEVMGTPMFISISGSPLSLGDLLRISLDGIDASPRISYNFGSAHFNYDLRTDLSDTEFNELDDLARFFARGGELKPREFSHHKSPRDVIADILRRETTLHFDADQIFSYNQSTRKLVHTLFHLAGDPDKDIAIPLPNWHFWTLCNDLSFSYFDGSTEDRLVDNFRKTARKGSIGALVLVHPTNPLGDPISEAAAKEIDAIAQLYGVNVIVDDVLRGVQPVGQRDSIARYITRPYVVEGFSKRFGDNPLGDLSYILAPRDARTSSGEPVSQALQRISVGRHDILSFFGRVLDYGYTRSTHLAQQELEDRNNIFDRGLRLDFSTADISRPSSSHLTTVVTLPQPTAREFHDHVLSSQGISTASIDGFYPDGYNPPTELQNKLRITVGQMDKSQIEEGAHVLGTALVSYYGRKR